jgi:hypothetical protein
MEVAKRREKSILYYYNNIGKYRQYYQQNKERLLAYQKERNKARRTHSKYNSHSKEKYLFTIEYRTVIVTFDFD